MLPFTCTKAPQQSSRARQSCGHCASLTIITREVLNGHVLDGDLFEEVRFLAARVPCDDPFSPEPLSQPRQVAVTVKRIGQEVSKCHMQTQCSLVFGFQTLRDPRILSLDTISVRVIPTFYLNSQALSYASILLKHVC